MLLIPLLHAYFGDRTVGFLLFRGLLVTMNLNAVEDLKLTFWTHDPALAGSSV